MSVMKQIILGVASHTLMLGKLLLISAAVQVVVLAFSRADAASCVIWLGTRPSLGQETQKHMLFFSPLNDGKQNASKFIERDSDIWSYQPA